MNDAKESVLGFPNCKGVLSYEQDECELEFDFDCDARGSILITSKPQPLTSENDWLRILSSDKRPTTKALKLEARTAEGYSIESGNVWLSSVNTPSDQESVRLEIKAQAGDLAIRVHDEEEDGKWQVEYWCAGLRAFGPVRANTELGTVAVGAPHTTENFHHLRGFVTFQKEISGDDLTGWLSQVDASCRHVFALLSFAAGTSLRYSLKRLCKNGDLARAEFPGAWHVFPHHKAPFHHLNLQPVLELALAESTAEAIERTGLDVALEWHLLHSTYDESRFLAQMTALEHLAHVYGENTDIETRVVPKSVYKHTVRPALNQALTELSSVLEPEVEDLDDVLEVFERKLGTLNQRTLRDRLLAMFSDYQVPLDSLEGHIAELIDVRNDIVHRGFHASGSSDDKLHYHLSAAEELFRRTFLAILNYAGNYTTWFQKIETRHFTRA